MSVQRYSFWATSTQQATFYGCTTEAEFPTSGVAGKDLAYCQTSGTLKKRNAANTAWVAVESGDVLMHTEVNATTLPGLVANARVSLIPQAGTPSGDVDGGTPLSIYGDPPIDGGAV